MFRLWLPLTVALVLAGCASERSDRAFESPAGVDSPAPELVRLLPLFGTWEGQGRLVAPAGDEPPKSFRGGGSRGWALGGKLVHSTGWHEIGPDAVARHIELIAWDPKAGKLRTWFFTDQGDIGEGWLSVDPDGRTFRSQVSGTRADGSSLKGRGVITLLSKDSMAWTWFEDGPAGEVQLEGRSKRTQGP